MTEIVFNANIIGELRKRAVAHNAQVTAEAQKMKLGAMKGLYKRFCNRPDLHEQALAKIDDHLDGLRKAQQPFDRNRHPREAGGRFRGTGGSAPPPVRRDSELLEAAQTQVIPETRYTVFGPPIAGAAGIAAGALAGATATPSGGPADRLVTRGLRTVGAKSGALIGQGAGLAAITIPREAARSAIGAANRGFGTRIPSPSPTAGARVAAAIEARGRRIGGAAGTATGRFSAFTTNYLPSVARRAAGAAAGGGVRGRLIGSVAGGAVGAVFPGALLWAPSLAHAQAQIGPYEDALFPRRVKKMAGDWLTSPEVLAKQAEILGDPALLAEFGGDDVLEKLSLGAVTRLGRAVAARFRRAHAAGEPAGPPPRAEAIGGATFRSRPGPFSARAARGGRAIITGRHVLAVAGAGSGVGAIAGAGLAAFNEKHPRDQRGRFARGRAMSRKGAVTGAVVGAGLGLLTGIVAARRGHADFLAAGLARLRGEQPVGGENLPEVMRAQAQKTAETAHAHDFQAANKHLIPDFAPGGGDATHVAQSLAAHAERNWLAGEGGAIQNGARAYYHWQIERAFNHRAWVALRGAGPRPRALDGSPLRAGDNLLAEVDTAHFTPNQHKFWDDLVARRKDAENKIEDIYSRRRASQAAIEDSTSTLRSEKAKLTRLISGGAGAKSLEDTFADLVDEPRTTLAQLRVFAKQHLEHDLTIPADAKSTAANRALAITEIEGKMKAFEAELHARLARVEAELDPARLDDFVNAARNHVSADLLPDESIPNPFYRARDRFFRPADRFIRSRPEGANTPAGFKRLKDAIGAAAALPFMEASAASGASAIAHLDTLIAAREAALQAGIPSAGRAARAFKHIAPALSGRIDRALADAAALSGARRENMSGFQRRMADLVHAHQDPRQALVTTRALALKASRGGKKLTGGALRNWKTIASIMGPLTAFGVVDLTQPFGQNVQFNPKKWRHPQNMGIITEWPDPIRRPHEAIVGLGYRTPGGQNRLLHGMHIYNAEGGHNVLPFGTDLDAVRNALRGGGGGGGGGGARVEPVRMQNPRMVDDSIEVLRKQGHIRKAGPDDFQFEQREGGSADTATREYRDSFWNQHLKFMERDERYKGRSNRQGQYYDSLRTLFDDGRAAVLDMESRAQLLVGNHRPMASGGRRGIFAGTADVYKTPHQTINEKGAIERELTRQIAIHAPGTPEHYGLMRRAMWLASDYYHLEPGQKANINTALDNHYERVTGKAPPTAHSNDDQGASAVEPAIRASQGESAADRFAERFTRDTPPGVRPKSLESDEEFSSHVKFVYLARRRQLLLDDANLDDGEMHSRAVQGVRAWLQTNGMKKAAPDGGLLKLADLGQPRKLRIAGAAAPKIAGISGASAGPIHAPTMRPRISGSAVTSPIPQAVPGAPKAPGIGQEVRRSTRPAHALGQLGTYGGGEAGYQAASRAASYLIPGGGALRATARFATGILGGGVGATAAGSAGRKAGRGVGDKAREPRQNTGETLTRLGAGAAGQISGGALIGGALGTLGAGPVGTVVGATLGGALTGYLSDETAGILYRHLKRYGAHVPKKIMGDHPALRKFA